MDKLSAEKSSLDLLAKNYTDEVDRSDYYHLKKSAAIKIYKDYIQGGGTLLELGCSFGFSTAKFSELVDEVVVVEAVEGFIQQAKVSTEACDNVKFVNMLFEEMKFEDEFDYIVANYVLEHVEDDNKIMQLCHRALKVNGLLFAAVPNAQAFSRQMAVEMGLMESIYDLTENDRRYGHRRTYDMNGFMKIFSSNNFEIIKSEGDFIKPFADFQLIKMLDMDIIGSSQFDGLVKMGKIYPTLCQGLCIIAKKQ